MKAFDQNVGRKRHDRVPLLCQQWRRSLAETRRACLPALILLALVGSPGCPGRWIEVEIDERGVLVGEGLLEKRRLFSLESPLDGGRWHIIDMAPAKEPAQLAILALQLSLDDKWVDTVLHIVNAENGSVISSQHFAADFCGYAELVDVTGDGAFEGLCHGGGFSDVGLFDSEGHALWTFDGGGFGLEGGAAEAVDAGDIDGDGELEFCIGFSESIGCFNANGDQLWRVTNGLWYDQVRIVRTSNTDVRILAVASGRLPYLETWDAAGTQLQRLEAPIDYSFDLVAWPTDQDGPSLLSQGGGRRHVYGGSSLFFRDLDGQPTMEYAVPDPIVGIDGFAIGYGVIGDGLQQYLAVNLAAGYVVSPVGGAGATRSALVLYDPAGDVAYFEVLDVVVALHSVAFSGTGDPRTLMVTGSDVFGLRLSDGAIASSLPPEAGISRMPSDADAR